MEFNNRVLKELSDEEGVKTTVYTCTAGHLTIGIGHNLDTCPVDNIIGRHLRMGDSITHDELVKIFNYDVAHMEDLLDKYLSWWRDLPTFSRYVILSLCFNMGIGGLVSTNPIKYNGLRGFPTTLRKLQASDWNGAASGLEDSKWYTQVGIRGKKLCTILRTQKFPDGSEE